MERSNTFIGASIPEEATLKDEIVVIVDPFSTGAHLAAEVCKQGFRCARVFSVWDSPVAALVQKGLKIDYCATLQFNDRIPEHEIALVEVSVCASLWFSTSHQPPLTSLTRTSDDQQPQGAALPHPRHHPRRRDRYANTRGHSYRPSACISLVPNTDLS